MADPEFAAAKISLGDVTRRLGLAGFGAWWFGELSSFVPGRVRSAIERRRLRPVVAIDGERITFWRPSQQGETAGMRESASVAAAGDTATIAAQGRAALDAIFAGNPAQRDVTLALGPRQVLRRTVKLPAAVEENLRATIGYDIDRLTPFKPEDLLFDAVVSERDPARREITVDVVTARRRVVDHALALVRSFGADVVAVVADAPRDAAASRINLLTSEDRDEGSRYLRWQFLVPLVALLALVAAVATVPLWQKRDYAIAMMNTTDEAAARAQQSDRLRGELDRMVGEYNFALERKYTTPGVAQVLDEVTRLLPDDTWLTQFEIKSSVRGKVAQRELFMRGESANAGKLISLLENAKLVGQAAPRSPTTKLQPGPGESFDIGAHVKSIGLPDKIALTESTRAAPRSAAPAPVTAPPAPATAATAAPAAAAAARAGAATAAAPGPASTPAATAKVPPRLAMPGPSAAPSSAKIAAPADAAATPAPAPRRTRAVVPGRPSVVKEAQPAHAAPMAAPAAQAPDADDADDTDTEDAQ